MHLFHIFLFSIAALTFMPSTAKGEGELHPPIYLYDLTPLMSTDTHKVDEARRVWDEFHLVASLQGLVNREKPTLFLRVNAQPDDFWLEQLRAEGAWCHGREVVRVESLEELLKAFEDYYDGAVVYDERVPATSNLASTIAGVEDLVCLRYDDSENSLYQWLVERNPILKVERRLIKDDGSPMFTGAGTIPDTTLPSTGSAKNDAYRWLVERYLKTGKTNPRLLGYYIDAFWIRCGFVSGPENNTLTNHDYIIAKKGLFFDLSSWDDETPVDDPGQKLGTDVETLQVIMGTACNLLGNKEMIHIAGYTPWAFKYTDFTSPNWSAKGSHGGVPTEWKFSEIISSYNGYLDADALAFSSLVNGSFYMHYSLPEKISQEPPLDENAMIEKGILNPDGTIVPRNYYAHYVGDYDSAAWLYWHLPKFWPDKARGSIPLNWAFNPNLAERFPFGMHWARKHATLNDYFITGDSGAGYVNPRNFSEPRPYSELPGAMDVWEKHCRKFMEQWDLTIVGFVLDGFADNMLTEGWDAYSRFSPDGIVMQSYAGPPGIHNGMPYKASNGDLSNKSVEAAATIRGEFRDQTPNFITFRSVLRSPGWYLQVEKEIDSQGRGNAMLVDMHTLLWLLERHLESASNK